MFPIKGQNLLINLTLVSTLMSIKLVENLLLINKKLLIPLKESYL